MCPTHPDRPGIVTLRDGSTPCWQCYLTPAEFALRFPKDFYQRTEDRGQRTDE